MVRSKKDLSEAELVCQQALTKTTMCSFFERGRCTKGDNCTHAHDKDQLAIKPNLQKTSLCKQYPLGKCNRGSDCRYAHGAKELAGTLTFYKTKMCRAGSKCKLGAECRYAHSIAEIREVKTNNWTVIPSKYGAIPKLDVPNRGWAHPAEKGRTSTVENSILSIFSWDGHYDDALKNNGMIQRSGSSPTDTGSCEGSSKTRSISTRSGTCTPDADAPLSRAPSSEDISDHISQDATKPRPKTEGKRNARETTGREERVNGTTFYHPLRTRPQMRRPRMGKEATLRAGTCMGKSSEAGGTPAPMNWGPQVDDGRSTATFNTTDGRHDFAAGSPSSVRVKGIFMTHEGVREMMGLSLNSHSHVDLEAGIYGTNRSTKNGFNEERLGELKTEASQWLSQETDKKEKRKGKGDNNNDDHLSVPLDLMIPSEKMRKRQPLSNSTDVWWAPCDDANVAAYAVPFPTSQPIRSPIGYPSHYPEGWNPWQAGQRDFGDILQRGCSF